MDGMLPTGTDKAFGLTTIAVLEDAGNKDFTGGGGNKGLAGGAGNKGLADGGGKAFGGDTPVLPGSAPIAPLLDGGGRRCGRGGKASLGPVQSNVIGRGEYHAGPGDPMFILTLDAA